MAWNLESGPRDLASQLVGIKVMQVLRGNQKNGRCEWDLLRETPPPFSMFSNWEEKLSKFHGG